MIDTDHTLDELPPLLKEPAGPEVWEDFPLHDLFMWMVLGTLIYIAISVLLAFRFPLGMSFLIVQVWPLWWFYRRMRSRGYGISPYLGKKVDRLPIYTLFWLVPSAICFSLVLAAAVFIPLSYLSPEWTLNWLDSEPFLFTAEGDWKPWSSVLSVALFGVMLAPAAEELLFRGLVFQRMAWKWSPLKGAILSSLIFGFFHSNVLGTTFFGIMMCLLYARFGSLWIPIFAHMFNNLLAFLIEAFWVETEGVAPLQLQDLRQFSGWDPIFVVFGIPAVIYLWRGWPLLKRSPPPLLLDLKPEWRHIAVTPEEYQARRWKSLIS